MPANESFAILTRVRAQYGNRLTFADYMEMASSKSVPESAMFLQEKTQYGAYFDRVEQTPTRGWLESQLRKAYTERCLSLCKFGKQSFSCFLEYTLLKSSVDELLGFLRCLLAGQPEKYVPSDRFEKGDPYFTISGLERICTREELFDRLSGTFFENLLQPILHQQDAMELPLVEAVLDRSVLAFMEKQCKKFDGKTQKELLEILYMKAELWDFELIYRSKMYYSAGPSLLRALQSGAHRYLSEKEIEEMISSPDAESVMRIFRDGKYGKKLSKNKSGGENILLAENLSDLFLPNLLRNRIHFGTQPAVVLFAYLNWMELEIKNLTYIIEGVRYRMPPEEICKLLFLPDRERM